ncbi:MAG: tetratricopeptide repeat protein [bacterium]
MPDKEPETDNKKMEESNLELENSVDAELDLAKHLIENGMFEHAESHLLKALEIDNNSISAHNQLGIVYFSRSEYDKAESHFIKALQIDFNIPETHFNLATLYQKQGRFKDALPYYKEVLKFNPEDHEVYYLMGQCAQCEGMLQSAEEFFRESFRLFPTPQSALDLSILYITEDKYNEAEETLNYLVSMLENENSINESKYKDDLESIHFTLGLILEKQNKYVEALNHFHKVVKIDELNEKAFNHLGICCNAVGMHEEAETFFAKASKLDKHYADPVINLGKLYYAQGKFKEAISAFEHYLELKKELGDDHVENEILDLLDDSYVHIGETRKTSENLNEIKEKLIELCKQDEYELAYEIARQLVRQLPDDAEIQNDYAVICHKLGMIDEAHKAIERAIKLAPNNPDVKENYQLIKQDLCEVKKEEKNIDNFLYIYPFEKHKKLEHTKRARIFTDTRCNVRCRFCYYVTRHSEEWPIELIKRQIDFAAQAGMKDIDFSGGESSFRKDFIELIEYASKYNFRSICTLTNGIKFADEDFMQRAVNAGLTEILFSIHGYDEQNHDWLTMAKGSYKKIHRAIELAKKYGAAIRTNTTVTSANYERLEEHAKIIRDEIEPFQANFILFNEWAEAVKMAENFAVKYSSASVYVKKAIDILKDSVPYINARYIPFCFMGGYEKHVCDYPQKIYDPFEWSQRMMALCQKPFIEEPLKFYQYLIMELNERSHNINLDPSCITDHVADEVFMANIRNGYVKKESCRDCKFYYLCDGVERSYAQYIGLDELNPISGEKITNPLEFREDFYDGYEKFLPKRSHPQIINVKTKKASVVIPTYNRSSVLEECLESLTKQNFDHNDFEVLVADDGSEDGTSEVINKFQNKLDLKYLRQNHAGPAAARNLAIKNSIGDLVVIINDDAIVEEDFLKKHYKLYNDFGKNDKIAILGNRCFDENDRLRLMNYLYEAVPLYTPLHSEKRGYYSAGYFITFNISAPRTAFRYGLFDEDFPSAIAEDTELGIRWQLNGVKIYFEPSIKAFHKHKMTVDGWDNQIIRQYTNSLIMFKKHPEFKPNNYFMDNPKDKMLAFIKANSEYMEKFRNELKNIESDNILYLKGITFMGKLINDVNDIVNIVRQVAPSYKMYRSFVHYTQK